MRDELVVKALGWGFGLVILAVLVVGGLWCIHYSDIDHNRTLRFRDCVGQHVPADECAKAASGVR